jgi:GT2 family glycosyltransferase/glycosyltransferase involved in cell wall biosynthesis
MSNIFTDFGLIDPADNATSCLKNGNSALRFGDYGSAVSLYLQAFQQIYGFDRIIAGNIRIAQNKFKYQSRRNERKRVAICGWSLAHNAAGRVYTLAKIYEEFADVEIIGSFFPKWGCELWEPIRNTTLQYHSFVAESEGRFLEQAMVLVAEHPYDIVHLSKPRIPNIFFGLLYKLIWNATVLMDIDDEELAFVKADQSVTVQTYLQEVGRLPELKNLPGKEWTQLAVGLACEFDALTVSNDALKSRYGGEIIGHARDPRSFSLGTGVRESNRQAFGIRPDQKVVLFLGTPRPHKGLLEVARAIQSLQRDDIVFAIVGSFDASCQVFKAQLEGVKGVRYLFVENQPFEELSRILAMADCCALLQDPGHPCSEFQIPAKLSDALAMRVPVIATPTPALADPIAASAVMPTTADNLATQLAAVLDHSCASQADAGQRYFNENLTIAVNAARLKQVLDITQSSPLSQELLLFLKALSVCAPRLDALAELAAPMNMYVSERFRALGEVQVHQCKLAIAVHIYYPEIWPEIAQRLKTLRHPFILDITTPPELAAIVEPAVKHDFPAANIHIVPNRGMDILPFLSLVPRWQKEGVIAVCKLHTKKGDGGENAMYWRRHLLDTLIGHPDTPSRILRAFLDHVSLGLVGPAVFYLSAQRLMYENSPKLQQISQELGHGPLSQIDWGFFAGTMFWARPDALASLARIAANNSQVGTDDYSKDGQYEHALERAFGLLPYCPGGKIGLLHHSANPTDTPELQIVEAFTPAARQLINPAHASQAVRQIYSLVDWDAQCRKPRQSGLVSIIIPVYNQPELTAACIASIYQHTAIEHFQLVLVDNGSDFSTQNLLQDIARKYANVFLLRNAENVNFSHGCNLGYAASAGSIVVFLNNDTTVTSGWLPPLVEALRRSDVAAVQPKLLYPDGSIQCIGIVFSAYTSLGYPIYAGMQPQHHWANSSRSFQAVTGACMALRAKDFAQLRGFDSVYVNGQEDVDLCLRLNQLYTKNSCWVATDSIVMHHESKTPNRFMNVTHNRSTFVRRWHGKVNSDDLDYYMADGFSVTGYQVDSLNKLPEDLRVFRANIVPASTTQSTSQG